MVSLLPLTRCLMSEVYLLTDTAEFRVYKPSNWWVPLEITKTRGGRDLIVYGDLVRLYGVCFVFKGEPGDPITFTCQLLGRLSEKVKNSGPEHHDILALSMG